MFMLFTYCQPWMLVNYGERGVMSYREQLLRYQQEWQHTAVLCKNSCSEFS